MTNTDSLQRAIDALGAVEVAPGRYAVRIDDTQNHVAFGAWATFAAEDMSADGALMALGAQMPAWWTPERRFAVRNINSGEIVPDAVLRGSPLAYQGVTASLETGELIAANLKDVPRSQIYGAS